jgi:PhnB protein
VFARPPAVKPRPKGLPMFQLDSYLFFEGNCAEAMRYYERTLGGKIEMMMTNGESPEAGQECPGGSADAVLHAHLIVQGRSLMASDWMAPDPYPGMKGFSISLSYDTPAEARRIYDALSAGGKATMPMAKTFWSEAFGMLVDRYGTPWMVSAASPKP